MSTIVLTSEQITCMIYDQRSISMNRTWYVGTSDGEIIVFDVSFRMVRRWKGHERWVSGLVFPLDGGLVSGSWDGSVKMWDLEAGRVEEPPSGEDPPSGVWARNLGGGRVGGGRVNALTELPGGRVAAGSHDGTVRVLDLGTGQEIVVCRGHPRWVYAVISLGDPCAGSFASGSGDKTIRVWTTSPIGGASATEGGTTSSGTAVRVVEVGSQVYSLSISPCGRMVASGCEDGSVRLFRLPEWDTVWLMKVHTDMVNSVSFSPDGRFLASGSDDKTVKILCSKTGIVLMTFAGHIDWVRSVLFSQNGTKVISCSRDKTVRMWSLCPDLDAQMASLIYGKKGSAFKNIYQRVLNYCL